MGILITILLISIIIFIIGLYIIKTPILIDDRVSGFVMILFALLLSVLVIKQKTVYTSESVSIDINELSIMFDDDVIIIRYDNKINLYKQISEYNNIMDSTFSFMEIKEYNVLNEYNGSTFNLMIEDKDEDEDGDE